MLRISIYRSCGRGVVCTMYATALLWLPHSCTGKPLNKMNPFPSISSFRKTPRKCAKLLSRKVSCEMPVSGVALAMKASAVSEISLTSASEKTCVHCSGWPGHCVSQDT
jgi:hypothetical protein